MMTDQVYRFLLSAEGMDGARERLANRYSWFLHVTQAERLPGILAHGGLVPCNPGAYPPHEVVDAIGAEGGQITCFRPIFTQDTNPLRDNQVLLAISNSDLPRRIGLDWSHGNCRGYVETLIAANPDALPLAIFEEVVRILGTVVSYDITPADAIRIWTNGTPKNDPSKWPNLNAETSRCAARA